MAASQDVESRSRPDSQQTLRVLATSFGGLYFYKKATEQLPIVFWLGASCSNRQGTLTNGSDVAPQPKERSNLIFMVAIGGHRLYCSWPLRPTAACISNVCFYTRTLGRKEELEANDDQD